MIFFFYGEDAFRAKQKIEAIKAKFKESVDPQGHNLHFLDSQDFSLEKFFDSTGSRGLLATKKLIIMKNIFDVDDFKNVETRLIDWLKTQKNTKEENYVIFWQTSAVRKTGKLFKKLKGLKYNEEFTQLSSANLQKWIIFVTKNMNCNITTEASNLLIALVGTDTWQLHNELHKLAHQGQSTISAQMVKESVTAKASDKIFELIDACAQRNKKLAHTLINDQLANGLEPIYLLSMIIRQFRLIVKARGVLEQTNNSYALAEKLNLHPYVAKKIMSQARNFNRKQLHDIYQLLVETDHRLKYETKNQQASFALLIEKM